MNRLICFLVLLLCGCGEISFSIQGYKKAVRSGINQIPEASQFDEIFGKDNVDHSISFSGSLEKGSKFYSTAYFEDRYTLTMAVPVRMGRSFDKVLEVLGEPKFYFCEVKDISVSKSGITGNSYHRNPEVPYPFDASTWNKIYKANGDFSVVGIPIKKNQPVENFQAFETSHRKPMVKIER